VTKTFQKKNIFLPGPGVSVKKERKKERKKSPWYLFLKSHHDTFQSLTAHHWSLYRDFWVLRDWRVAVHSCQENKKSRVKIHPQRKKHPTTESRSTPKERNNQQLTRWTNQTQEKSIYANQWGNRERSRLVTKANFIEICNKIDKIALMFCRKSRCLSVFSRLLTKAEGYREDFVEWEPCF